MINPQELYNRAMEAADELVEKEEIANTFADAVEALEGIIIEDLKAKGEPTTIVSKLAKKDMRYIIMKNDWRGAINDFHRAKYKYEQACKFQDNVRTKESTERQLGR